MHCAVERQRDDTRDVISLLVSHGTPVDGIEFEDQAAMQLRGHLKRGTALHLACQLDNMAAASALVEHGANPLSTRRHYGEEELTTPLDIAKARANNEMVEMLDSALGRLL